MNSSVYFIKALKRRHKYQLNLLRLLANIVKNKNPFYDPRPWV